MRAGSSTSSRRLIDPKRRTALDTENRELQERLRIQHAEKVRKPLLPLEQARANRVKAVHSDPLHHRSLGTRTVEPPLADLVSFIDWQFFFHAWDLKGKFPAILANPAARELYDDARALLREILQGASLRAVGIYGFWPAHADGDDVVYRRHALLVPAPAGGPRRRAAEPLPRRLRRAARTTSWEPSPSGSTVQTSSPRATRRRTTTTRRSR